MKEKYDIWTKEFMESWKQLDWRRTLQTLSKNVKYYENPIDEPCKNFEEVVNLWNVVEENQKDINCKYKIISFDENVGIFQISLNEEGKCTYFKQWRFTR